MDRFFQGMLMFFALLIVPIVAYAFIKADFSSVVSEMPGYMNFLKESDGSTSTWQYVVSNLAWGLGYFGMPHIIIRFMSIKSQKDLKKSAKIGITWTLLIVFFATLIGVIGRLFLGFDESINENSLVFIQIVRKIFPGCYLRYTPLSSACRFHEYRRQPAACCFICFLE